MAPIRTRSSQENKDADFPALVTNMMGLPFHSLLGVTHLQILDHLEGEERTVLECPSRRSQAMKKSLTNEQIRFGKVVLSYTGRSVV